MRTCWVQFKRELGAILLSPIAYVFLFCMTLLNGWAFQTAAGIMGEGARFSSVMQVFFLLFFFWFGLILMIPILTMRVFSEEYKSGTIEMLLTAPIREWEVVLAKFFGTFAFYFLIWLPPLFFFMAYQMLTKGQFPVDWPSLGMSYAMTCLIGMFYISIGIFASSLTKNQIVAAVISFSAISLIFYVNFLPQKTNSPYLLELINYVSCYSHMRTFTTGSFDSRPVVFYLSSTILFLVLTERTLAVRKLRS